MSKKIRKNDNVIVITGKYKGKKGIVKKFLSSNKVIVSGINIIKKHQKSIPEKNVMGGIVKKESYIQVSNLKIFNHITGKPDRVGFKFLDGKKVRFFKSNNKIIKKNKLL
ncbi:50S ribosomal protein L24 [Buchnera aphidicola (Chaitoregma tattakana)]|uniref:50S ribosomal protein L24 n=1 Tax=Buchnera aphidicola TaxID=9 RepID=UPI0031B867F2